MRRAHTQRALRLMLGVRARGCTKHLWPPQSRALFRASAIFSLFYYVLIFKKAFVKNLSEQSFLFPNMMSANTRFKIVESLGGCIWKCDLAIEKANSLSLKQCPSISHFPKWQPQDFPYNLSMVSYTSYLGKE